MASVWSFSAVVVEPQTTSGSTTYRIDVSTNLASYAGEDEEPTEEQAGDGETDDELTSLDAETHVSTRKELVQAVRALTLTAETHFSVRRSYTEFVKLRDTLAKSGLPGALALPPLPSKTLFATSAADIEKRLAAFNALFKHISQHDTLASSDAVTAFLSDVPPPNFEAVHAAALRAMAEMVAQPAEGWDVRYAKNGISIAVQKAENSKLYMIRSDVVVALPVARTHALYTHTGTWSEWTPDAQFTEIERVSEAAAVLHVLYKIPVISDRDVCIYQAALAGKPGDPAAADCHTAVAMSIEHPRCPKQSGVVRARLLISVTAFEAHGDGTRITSWQHADPRGIVPASVVNACLTRGKAQLKTMRAVMEQRA